MLELLFEPVYLVFEVDHAHEDAVGLCNGFRCLGVLLFEVDICPLGELGIAGHHGLDLFPEACVVVLEAYDRRNLSLLCHLHV